MREERLEVSVTFDERGYIGSAPELRSAVVALSLGGLRRKIEALLLPDEVEIVLQLDGHAAAHPELVIAVMNAASSDWAASRLAVAIEQVAVALLAEDEQMQNGPGIVRAHGVVRTPALKISVVSNFIQTRTQDRLSCASSCRTKQRGASAVVLLMLSKSLNQTSIEELTIL